MSARDCFPPIGPVTSGRSANTAVGRNRFIAPPGQASWIAARREADGAIKRLRPSSHRRREAAQLAAAAFMLSIRAANAINMGVDPVFYVQLPSFICATALKRR